MDNVVVTGASRGIGLAIAERLAREGFRVLAVARRDTDALAAAAAKHSEGGVGALIFRALDLSDVAAIPTFVRELRGQFGPIVNNARLGTAGLLATMPDAEIKGLIQLNTLSPIVLSKYVV